MMAASSVEVEAQIAQTLWAQWKSCGVLTAGAGAHRLIDPELLVIESARSGDSRLLDAATTWCVRHHDLLITARIKTLLAASVPDDQAAFRALAGHVSAHVARLSWPSDAPDRQWTPTTEVRLPTLSRPPELLRLRARALFGPNARADAVAFLRSIAPNDTELAVIEQATRFSKRRLAGPLQQLVEEGSVERSWLGNRQRFRLSETARNFLGYPKTTTTGPEWIDWCERFSLARICGEAASALRAGDVYSALGGIRIHSARFQRLGLSAPAPLLVDENAELRIPGVLEWVTSAVQDLVLA